jgi:hypothetical protein
LEQTAPVPRGDVVVFLGGARSWVQTMSTIAEIETDIENLPTPQVEELAIWLDAYRARRRRLA